MDIINDMMKRETLRVVLAREDQRVVDAADLPEDVAAEVRVIFRKRQIAGPGERYYSWNSFEISASELPKIPPVVVQVGKSKMLICFRRAPGAAMEYEIAKRIPRLKDMASLRDETIDRLRYDASMPTGALYTQRFTRYVRDGELDHHLTY